MSELTLTIEDGGRKVAIPLAGALTLRLPENATTGFRWEGEADPALTLIGDDYEPAGGAGGGGVRALRYRLTRPATVKLELVRRQAWEPDSEGDARFSIVVEALRD